MYQKGVGKVGGSGTGCMNVGQMWQAGARLCSSSWEAMQEQWSCLILARQEEVGQTA